MVNFTVTDLEAMRAQLREAGVEVDEKIEVLEGIGRFGWAVDPEGNRFEQGTRGVADVVTRRRPRGFLARPARGGRARSPRTSSYRVGRKIFATQWDVSTRTSCSTRAGSAPP